MSYSIKSLAVIEGYHNDSMTLDSNNEVTVSRSKKIVRDLNRVNSEANSWNLNKTHEISTKILAEYQIATRLYFYNKNNIQEILLYISLWIHETYCFKFVDIGVVQSFELKTEE